MTTNIINQTEPVVKVRLNLWQASDGSVIGYGALLAPGGFYFCFSCGSANCQHTTSVNEAWLAGKDNVLESYEVPASSGYHVTPVVTAPPFTLAPPSQADIDAVNNGSKPGAWRARSIEEVPSTWTRTVTL